MMDTNITDEDLVLFNHLDELEKNGPIRCNNLTKLDLSPNTIAPLFSQENVMQEPEIVEKAKYLQRLKMRFGHDEFKNKQWEIIRSLIEEKRDNCVVMATGYGKSLCFQFPSVYTNSITLVVCPLISLMQDQILSMERKGIPACPLGSAQTDPNIKQKILAGQYRIVYACPEYLEGNNGRELLLKLKNRLTLIAVDEAHCVSQWGHDFRTSFRRLGNIRDIIPGVPILACTATANVKVRQDIISILKLKNPQVIFTGADRPNLEFFVYGKSRSAWEDLRPHLTGSEGSTIIYVLKRAVAEDISQLLCKKGIVAEFYHSKVDLQKRQETLKKFKTDELKVIVATIAFGMGIDKPDVRCVIHYGASKNLETYYQEVGRAGRDNKHSKVITIFDSDDFGIHEYFLKCQQHKLTAHIIKCQQELAQRMCEYLYSPQCRRLLILKYFNDPFVPAPRPNCCDNCTRGSSHQRLSDIYQEVDDNGLFDLTADAKIAMNAVETMNNEKMRDIVDFILGILTANARKYNFSPHFGGGKLKQRSYWETVISQLINCSFVDKKSENRLVSTTDGIEWSHTNPLQPLKREAIGQMYQFFKKISDTQNIPASSTSNECGASNRYPKAEQAKPMKTDYTENIIRILLSAIRSELATIYKCSPLDICLDDSLNQMALRKPLNLDEFRASHINGFDEAKTLKFAPSFANGIAKLKYDQLSMATILNSFPMENSLDRKFHCGNHRYQILGEIRAYKSSTDIAAQLNLTEIEVLQQMINYMRRGWTASKIYLKSLCGITEEKIFRIKSLMIDTDYLNCSGIARIKMRCDPNDIITDGDIALTLNYFHVRKYLDNLKKPYIDCDANTVLGVKYLIVEPRKENVLEERATPALRNAGSRSNLASILNLIFHDDSTDEYYFNREYDGDDYYTDNTNSDENSDGSDDNANEPSSDDDSIIVSDVNETIESESNGSNEDSGSESEASDDDGKMLNCKRRRMNVIPSSSDDDE